MTLETQKPPAPGEGFPLRSTVETSSNHEGLSIVAQAGPFARGWKALLDAGFSPIPVRGKGAPPTGWTGASAPDASFADCYAWAEGDEGSLNIAIRLPDGVVGIDVDNYDGKQGAATLTQFESAHGKLPATWRTTSRKDEVSGIRLFRVPPGVEFRSDLGSTSGVEIIRRSHRYAVCAPSVHPDTHRVYEWREDSGMVTDAPQVAELPELPSAWIEALRKDLKVSTKPTTAAALAEDGAPMPAYVERVVGAELARLDACKASATGDGRNYRGEPWDTTTFEVACVLVEFANTSDAHYSMDRAHADLLAHAPLDAGFDADRIESKWDSARRKVGGQGRDLTGKLGVPVHAEEEEVRVPHRPRFTDFESVMQGDPPVPDWLIPGFLEREKQAALYGPAKCGKTLLVQDLLVSAALGRPVLGSMAPAKFVTLYLDAENTVGDWRARLFDFAVTPETAGEVTKHVLHWSFPELAPLDTFKGGRQLVEVVEAEGAELIVIDTISRFVEGDEDSADTWRNLYRFTLARLKGKGVAVLRLDHTGKDAARGMRGSSGKTTDVDVAWSMGASGETKRTLQRELSRSGNEREVFELTRMREPLRHEPSGVELTDVSELDALVALLNSNGVPRGIGRDATRDALAKLGVKKGNNALSAIAAMRKKTLDGGT